MVVAGTQPAALPPEVKARSERVPCRGGPVTYLAIHDFAAVIRRPEQVPMGDGVYRLTDGEYVWTPPTDTGQET